jgi:hypothetical protein
MRRRLTYANVAATLALVLAMSGGALAAGHYLINSTKQINPKVLKKLRGSRGPTGATGQRGATGAGGPAGKEGTSGKEGQPGAPASASVATSFVQTPTAIFPAEADTLVLSTSPSGKALALPGAGAHVLSEASVQVENTEVSQVELTCQLAWEGLAGGGHHLFGEPSTVDLEGIYVVRAEMPLTGNVSLVGGETYAVQVYCHVGLFNGEQAKITGGSINAIGPE